MDLLQFADDSALTPISELRQVAKARAKEGDQKLSSALDEVAQTLSYPRWDALMQECWTVQPQGGDESSTGTIQIVRNMPNQKLEILIEDFAPDERQLCLAVINLQEEDAPNRLFYVSTSPQLGRVLDLTDDEKTAVFDADTLQARIRATLPIILTHADHVPRLVGPSIIKRGRFTAALDAEAPEIVSTVEIVAEIPGTKDHFQATLNIGESRDSLIGWLRTDEIPDLYDFKVQKDGRIIARRAKFDNEVEAKTALNDAIRIVSFLSWTGLDYPKARDLNRAGSDKFRIGESDLFDHDHTLLDRKSRATVILNQPYSGNSSLITKGILNLLKSGTVTSEAAKFAGLYEGTHVFFHSLEGQGVDLDAIATGTLNAKLMTSRAEITHVQKDAASKAKGTRKKTETKTFLSPVTDFDFNLQSIPLNEKTLLSHHLPSVKQLQMPQWRNKMKAYQGRELLSWNLQDKYEGQGVTEKDIIEAVRSCPLDADIWGFFGIFDYTEATKAECYRRAVIAGELYLGRETFQEEAGDFWGALETRPYMRAMNSLYRSLVKMRRPAEALPLGKMMLELSSNDNLGIRFSIDDVAAATGAATLAAELAEAFQAQDAETD